MGQGGSAPKHNLTLDELSLQLTNTFATKCLNHLELYCFKQTFKSLAETQSALNYISESTLTRFLELPDVLNAGAVVFQLCSYLGAFPFPSQAPAILTNEALLRVVVILTGRHAKILKGGKNVWRREIWRGLAVFDRALGPAREVKEEVTQESDGEEDPVPTQGLQDFAIKDAPEDPEEEGGLEYDEDELVLAAFESMDAVGMLKQEDVTNVQHAMIPTDNFLRLLELLLLIAPLSPADSLSSVSADLDATRQNGLRQAARCIVSSFGVEKHPGIPYKVYDEVVSNTLPYLFDSFQPLFERFLFPKEFDLHKRKPSSTSSPQPPTQQSAEIKKATEPLLPKSGDILDINTLNQLSFIFGSGIFRRLQPLYLGNEDGFSMRQFEKAVFKWRAPTILLVSGRLIDPATKTTSARNFLDSLPHARLGPSLTSKGVLDDRSDRLTYGAYIPTPWKATTKSCFGTSTTKLVQLSPVHDVFEPSTLSDNYAYFTKSPASYPGLGFGSPLPNHSSSAHTSSTHSAARSMLLGEHIPLGPVSLHIDDALEYAAFTHLSTGGGSFHPSRLPPGARPTAPETGDWQDRFEIEALEVWGLGGDEEAAEQRRAWDWEEREAEARRRVNLGTGDVEADRQLLEMAGLVGGHGRTGGSMG